MDEGVDELKAVRMIENRVDYWDIVAVSAAEAMGGYVSEEWAEFGVATGRSCKHWIRHLSPISRLYAFDSWKGLPEPWDKGNRVMPVGTFGQPVPDFLRHHPQVEVVEGFVQDTLPYRFPAPLQFCHIDTDLYSAAACILDRVDEYLVNGTVLMFDEMWDNAGGGHYPNWREGEYKAYGEWLARSGKRVEWFLQTVGGSAGWVRT